MAERLGFEWHEALTLGRAVAGLNAYSKGKALGLFKPVPKTVKEQRKTIRGEAPLTVDLLYRAVPVQQTADGLRALSKEKPVDPDSVQRYLTSKFGDALAEVSKAMRRLAHSRKPTNLADDAYSLYEQFRPEIPAGKKGWSAADVSPSSHFCKLLSLHLQICEQNAIFATTTTTFLSILHASPVALSLRSS